MLFLNSNEIIEKLIYTIFFQLDLLLSGYVNDSSQDILLVRKLFHEMPSLPKSQNPRIREWKIILSLLRKALKVSFYFKIHTAFIDQSFKNELCDKQTDLMSHRTKKFAV